MGQNRPGTVPPRRVEAKLLKALGASVKNSAENLDRVECPGSDTIRAIATRDLSIPDFDDLVDHIAMCAPCLDEYQQERRRYRSRRLAVAGLGSAALILLASFGAYLEVRRLHPTVPIAKTVQTAASAVTLDYTQWTAERSGSSRAANRQPPKAAHGLLSLTLELPIGTEDGEYTATCRSETGGFVADGGGAALWKGRAEELEVILDLRGAAAGNYILELRSPSGTVRKYPLTLE